MDGYRDIYPWKYEWTQDFAPSVWHWIGKLEDAFVTVSVATYKNHKRLVGVTSGYTNERYTVDIFQGGGPHPRGQLHPDQINAVFDWVRANRKGSVERIVGNKRIWTPPNNVAVYNGIFGQCVDHVHVEFNGFLIDRWYTQGGV